MIEYFEFWVDGPPVPEARPRFRMMITWDAINRLRYILANNTGTSLFKMIPRAIQVIAHPTSECDAYKNKVRDIALRAAKAVGLKMFGKDVPLGATFLFYLPRARQQVTRDKNKKKTGTRTVVAKSKFPIKRGQPDNDNLQKGPQDGMEQRKRTVKLANGTKVPVLDPGLYPNDTQFIDTIVRKRFAASDDQAGCLIRLWTVETEDDYYPPIELMKGGDDDV